MKKYRNNLENHNLNDHFKNLDKIISKYLIFEKKRIIVFLIKEPYQNFIFDKNRKFLNYEFFVINIIYFTCIDYNCRSKSFSSW